MIRVYDPNLYYIFYLMYFINLSWGDGKWNLYSDDEISAKYFIEGLFFKVFANGLCSHYLETKPTYFYFHEFPLRDVVFIIWFHIICHSVTSKSYQCLPWIVVRSAQVSKRKEFRLCQLLVNLWTLEWYETLVL